MKNLKAFLPVLIAIVLISLIAVSCGSSKKAAVPCPDFSKSRSYRSDNTNSGKILPLSHATAPLFVRFG